jgi:hypothetical protein
VYLTAEFREKTDVRAAILALRSAGMRDQELDLFSEEPVEFPKSVLHRPSHMSLASGIGAVAFTSTATGFIWWAQHNYQLVTGGMPVFSWWATGVITYEMLMLGAIMATFGWFILESGLFRKRDPKVPIPRVRPGSICLRVRCAAQQAPVISEAMRTAGALVIDRSEP